MLKIIFQTSILFSLWLLSLSIKAQDTCVFLFTIPQNAHFATADHLANTYLLHGFEVEKYDSTGRFVSRYSNNRLGVPAFMDASNPMKILVWYADFQTAVFLDRNMTELGRLNVAEVGWPSVSSIAMASDGNLWIYDLASFKLMKITTSGEKYIESEPLNFGYEIKFASVNPIIIRENGEQVFVCFKSFGIIAFDIFGQNPDLIFGSSQFEQFEIIGNTITWFNAMLALFETQDLSNSSKKGPIIRAHFLYKKVFWLSQKRIFIQTDSGVEVYGYY